MPQQIADSLGLILTRRCRLSCFCCPVEKNGKSLSWADAKLALDWYLPGRFGKTACIKFAGGEPFLNFPVLRRSVEYAAKHHTGPLNFEVATGCGQFTKTRIDFFRAHPRLQLHLSHAEAAPALSSLPNVVANVLLDPLSCAAAPARMAGIFACGFRRVNILPAYFCRWTPAQTAQLEKTFLLSGALFAKLAHAGLELENIRRSGAVPLFNPGATVDVDGKVYPGNIVLAAFMKPYRKQLCAGSIGSPQRLDFSRLAPQQKLLRAALGRRIYEDTMRVDALLTEFVLAVQSRQRSSV